MPDTAVPLDELLAVAVDLAVRTGAMLAERREVAREDVTTKTSSTDMVTDADRAAEALIVGGLRDRRPDDGILGEEGTEHAGTSGVRWVIDPLDGTTNYLYGYPVYAVSIAAQVDGRTVVGVVHDAARGETFSASRGDGAHLDGGPIQVSGHDDLATALVGTGFAYLPERRAEQAAVLTRLLPVVRDVRRGGAAALDLAWVACGRLDAYYERGLQPWDLAAGELLVLEAGGRTGGLDGEPVASGSLWATTPALADPLTALLRDAGAMPS